MSTRWAFGFRKNGKTKLIYNHFDSYPEGLGKEFTDWLLQRTPEEIDQTYEKLKMGRSDTYWIDEFIASWDLDQRAIVWDEVKEEDLEDCYIEYSYIYDIDTGELETEWDDHRWLSKLEKEFKEKKNQEDNNTTEDKIFLVATYDYDENGTYYTITDTREKAEAIAKKEIKELKERFPDAEPEEETDTSISIDEAGAVEIREVNKDERATTWLGGEVLGVQAC